jgi:hypothetical protein
MRRLLPAALILLAGCGQPQATAAPEPLVEAVAPPAEGLWVAVGGAGEHATPIPHASVLPWAVAGWVVEDGSTVAPGDPVLRYDEDDLRRRIERDLPDVAADDARRRLDLLRAESEVERQRSRMRQLEARRAVEAAELAAAERIDEAAVRIAELELADARTAHAAAHTRRERLEAIAAAGAPVSQAELARAREEEVRTRAESAAPEVALELARLPASRSTVTRLRLAVADLDAQIGDGEGDGARAALRVAEERLRRREAEQAAIGGDRRRRNLALRQETLRDPAVRARAGGLAVHARDDLRRGMRMSKDSASVLVLDPGGMTARLELPAALRPLIAVGAAVRLAPATDPQLRLQAEIVAIAPLPRDLPDGRQVFPAALRFASPPAGLRPGMRVAAEVRLELPPGAALVPGFAVGGASGSRVLMADGGARELRGWRLPGLFAATAGIAPGERVRLPAREPAAVRLGGVLEPAVAVPVRLTDADATWEVAEVMPAGARVAAGQRIARLIRVEPWRGADAVRAEAEARLAQAELDFAVDRLAAMESRASSRAGLLRAQIERRRAVLEAWVARNAWDPVAQARAAAGVAAAGVAVERSGRELAAAEEEFAAGGISAGRLAERRADLARSRIRAERAALAAAADELAVDAVRQRQLDDAADQGRGNELAALAGVLIWTENHRVWIAGAEARRERVRADVAQDLKGFADEELRSPAAGILIHAGGGLAPVPGRELSGGEPMSIAVGEARRVVLEVPAQRFGTVPVGRSLRLNGGGLSFTGTVAEVSPALLLPRRFHDELALGRTVGAEDRVFTVVVACSAEAAALPFGTVVHAEL